MSLMLARLIYNTCHSVCWRDGLMRKLKTSKNVFLVAMIIASLLCLQGCHVVRGPGQDPYSAANVVSSE